MSKEQTAADLMYGIVWNEYNNRLIICPLEKIKNNNSCKFEGPLAECRMFTDQVARSLKYGNVTCRKREKKGGV